MSPHSGVYLHMEYCHIAPFIDFLQIQKSLDKAQYYKVRLKM